MALTLERIEAIAAAQGKLLRIQAPRRLGLWNLRVAVARPRPGQGPLLLGDLKGWAMPTASGLHLDTLRIQGQETVGVGELIWAATFAWAVFLEGYVTAVIGWLPRLLFGTAALTILFAPTSHPVWWGGCAAFAALLAWTLYGGGRRVPGASGVR